MSAHGCNHWPATPEIKQMTAGDYYTPEGRIGSIDIERDWESCIHAGVGWSYRGEDGFKGPEECIKMLVSCTTGGGNLLLNFGPRPDGTFTDGESDIAKAAGEWLKVYGEAIYGTRGGPFPNGTWGGSCHRGNKLFIHIFKWSDEESFGLPPLSRKILSARTLLGKPVSFESDEGALRVNVAPEDRDHPVTVIELTIDQPIEVGTLIGTMHAFSQDMTEYGEIISKNATLKTSSTCHPDNPEDHETFLRGTAAASGYAFHTNGELNPWAIVDLGSVRNLKAVVIENRSKDKRSEGLILSISENGEVWEDVWSAEEWQEEWLAEVTHFHAGIEVPGREARYLKFQLRGDESQCLMLKRIYAYGE